MLIESHPCRVDLSMATAHDHRCLLQLANVDGDVLLFEVKLGDQRMIQVLVFTCRLNSVEKRERFYTSTYGCGSNPCSFPGVPSLISNCSKYYCWFLSPIKLMVNIDQARHIATKLVQVFRIPHWLRSGAATMLRLFQGRSRRYWTTMRPALSTVLYQPLKHHVAFRTTMII